MLACFFVFRTVFQKKAKGFTLLEIILSIALIGILAASSLFALQNFQINNDLDAALANIIQSLRRAQLLSESVSGDSKWGVKIFSDKVVVFKGDNYTKGTAPGMKLLNFRLRFLLQVWERLFLTNSPANLRQRVSLP